MIILSKDCYLLKKLTIQVSVIGRENVGEQTVETIRQQDGTLKGNLKLTKNKREF